MSPGSTAPTANRREADVTATKPTRHGHLPINGLSLYHEVHGELDELMATLEPLAARLLAAQDW